MFPYILFLLVIIFITVLYDQSAFTFRPLQKFGIIWKFFSLLLISFIGLRYKIGNDWDAYLGHFERFRGEPISSVFLERDQGYYLINWLGAAFNLDIYFVNIICATIFSIGLIAYCRLLPRPWLALTVASSYLVIVVAMGYPRQSVSIGLVLYALVQYFQGRRYLACLYCLLASLFHSSALVSIPFLGLLFTDKLWLRITNLLLLLPAGYYITYSSIFEHVERFYFNSNYEAAGAGFRALTYLLPATLYIWLKKYFFFSLRISKYIKLSSIMTIAYCILLPLLPSSNAADRIALYLIPMQLAVWASLPDALRLAGYVKASFTVLFVCFYSLLTLLVWLLTAHNAFAWIPYRFYLWEILWR
jgi:hypothetical protein